MDKSWSRFCRDCRWAQVVGRDWLNYPTVVCAKKRWGPESWGRALRQRSCELYDPAEDKPGSLKFWGLPHDSDLAARS